MTDRIYRFIPNEERFVAYPVPLSGTYTRGMSFTNDGLICTSNNPIPAPALEGGVLEVICIDARYDDSSSSEVALSRNCREDSRASPHDRRLGGFAGKPSAT